MTFEEAKKILEKEGFHLVLAKKVINQTGAIREFEKPEVCEAIKVANANRWTVYLSPIEWDEREARLKKEYEENTKAPGSSENRIKEDSGVNPALKESASQFNDALLDEQSKKIDEQNREITRLFSLVEKKENSISRLYYEKSVLEKENEDLKKGEIPARYFDKALVDEQEEKIKKLEHEKLDILEMASSCKQTIAEQGKKIKSLDKEIARLNKVIHKKNLNIEKLVKQSSRHLDEKIKMFGENLDLKKSLRKTESLLHDTREANSRNLDTCFKNEDLIDELKKKLAEKTKLAKKYAKELSDSSLGLCKLEKQLKDKNAVLSDVAEELRLTKIREKNLAELGLKYVGENEKLKKELANKVVDKIDAQALKSAESALAYKEKVIAEKDEVIADLGNELAATKKELEEKAMLVEMIRNASKEYCDYGVAANEFIKKLASLYVLANNKGTINEEMLERCKNYQTYGFPANCNIETKKEINDIARGKTKVVGADIAEEGGDHSGVIVLCGTDFVKMLKENEDFIHDLFEKKHKEIKEFMYAEAEQLFEGDGIPTKMEVMKPSRKFKKVK